MKTKKVIFVCGSMGSGKTTFSEQHFPTFSMANIDTIYEELLYNNGLDLDISKLSGDDKQQSNILFDLAKNKLDNQLIKFINDENDIVIDSVGRDVNVIVNSKYYLESIGYTTYMVMVYCDLNVCIDRIQSRPRKYNQNMIIESWHAAYGNISLYKKTFKNKFILIQTDTDISIQNLLKI